MDKLINDCMKTFFAAFVIGISLSICSMIFMGMGMAAAVSSFM